MFTRMARINAKALPRPASITSICTYLQSIAPICAFFPEKKDCLFFMKTWLAPLLNALAVRPIACPAFAGIEGWDVGAWEPGVVASRARPRAIYLSPLGGFQSAGGRIILSILSKSRSRHLSPATRHYRSAFAACCLAWRSSGVNGNSARHFIHSACADFLSPMVRYASASDS